MLPVTGSHIYPLTSLFLYYPSQISQSQITKEKVTYDNMKIPISNLKTHRFNFFLTRACFDFRHNRGSVTRDHDLSARAKQARLRTESLNLRSGMVSEPVQRYIVEFCACS